MYAAFSTPRPVSAPSRAIPLNAQHGSLQLHEILAHVARRGAPQDTPGLLARLLEAAEACSQMNAARHGLTQALDVQDQIERLVELAQGREQAQGLPQRRRALEALKAPRAVAQARAACALATWRSVGQRFAQLTGLLPTQLPHGLAWPAAASSDQRQRWPGVRGATANAQALFDRQQERWAVAQSRCERADRLVRSACAGRQQAQLDWRIGQGSHAALAHAWLSELDARGVLLQAEAERAAAHTALGLLGAAAAVPA